MALRDNVGSNALLAGAIVCGALILSWRAPTSEPHYQIASSGNAIVRLDTENGAMIECDLHACHPIQVAAPAQTANPVTNVFNNVRSKLEQRQIDQAKK